ncbi:GntR family transcriptional regulator [Piscinibacter sakaiensis]|uniref:GntR family transcriptional regulator n=1 Tax=Piscinibacter sakaiensis TaxID=1547922 RepID=UPI003AAA593E
MNRDAAVQGLQPVEREPLWDQVYGQLRDALFAGKFEPGSRLVLRDLAEMLGTSITPVRDAVARLVANGTLERGPRNTALVPDVGAVDMRHLIIVRSELEGRAAREAALRSDEAGIALLKHRLVQMRELIAARELDAYLDLHRQFHFGIYEMAGIPILREMIESLWLRCGPALSFVIPDYVRLLKGTDHHMKLIDALARHDADAAEQAIVADIEEAGQYLVGLADAHGRIRRPARLVA